MKILSKPEELLMLAVWTLKEQAYGLEILKYVSEKTGSDWSVGSVYVPLDRLVRDGYLETYQGEATAKRGGKRKRFYKITKEGIECLMENVRVHEEMVKGIPEITGGRINPT